MKIPLSLIALLLSCAVFTGCASTPLAKPGSTAVSTPTAPQAHIEQKPSLGSKITAVICGSQGTGFLAGGGIGYLIGDLAGLNKTATTIIGAALGANCGQLAEDRLRRELAAQGQTNCQVRSRSVYRDNVKYVIAEVENCSGTIARNGYRNYGTSGTTPLNEEITEAERELFEFTQSDERHSSHYERGQWRKYLRKSDY